LIATVTAFGGLPNPKRSQDCACGRARGEITSLLSKMLCNFWIATNSKAVADGVFGWRAEVSVTASLSLLDERLGVSDNERRVPSSASTLLWSW